MNIPKVSVVIPCYNGGKRIGVTLEFLKNQSYNNFEIVVVNDGSIDNTEKILEGLKIDNFRYLTQINKGIGAARDVGVRVADGEIIAFTDDDRMPDEDWIKNAVKCFEDQDVSGVQGSIILINRKHANPRTMRIQRDITKLDWRFATANIFYRKKEILDVGGFDHRFRTNAEDGDLAWRIIENGGKIVFCKDSIIWHKAKAFSYTKRLKDTKRNVLSVLFFKKHPKLRKKLILRFINRKEDLYPLLCYLSILFYFFSLAGMSINVAFALLILSILFCLFTRIIVDIRFWKYPKRLIGLGFWIPIDFLTTFWFLIGSIRYKTILI